jgi:hypothetical protein
MLGMTLTRSTAPLLAGAFALAVLVLQYVVSPPESDALREFLVVCAMIAACTAIVFGVVIPRAAAGTHSAGIALTLSLLGLLTAAAYWSGLPPVLGLGGVVLARRGPQTGLARGAFAVGVLAIVADLAMLIVDAATS